tara:strand:- start:9 stop:635 length:627 start_codon:yes stop_codon:yes gene_type:complete
MKWIKPIKLYTDETQPLRTKEGIRFYFEYKNIGKESVGDFPAEILMGDAVRSVSLPGLGPDQSKVVEMLLTNSISDEVSTVGVRLGPDDDSTIIESFSWIGRIELYVDELKRYDFKDTKEDFFYRVYIHNKGTKRARKVHVIIEKDNEFYGDVFIDELGPKKSMPINIGFDKRLEGLFKIGVTAHIAKQKHISASRSYHIELSKDQET